MLELADIEFTTRGMYQGYIERTIRPALGDYEIGFLEKHPELLDRLYASGLVLPDRLAERLPLLREPQRVPSFPDRVLNRC